MRVAKAVVIGAAAFAVTLTTLYAMVFGHFVLWLTVPVRWQPRALQIAAFVALNLMLAVIAVITPVWLAFFGARRLAVSPVLSTLVAVVLMGFVA
jgi:hypothetical protein